MLNAIKSWSVTCGLRLNGLDSSVSFIPGFCAPSGMPWVVCRRPSLLSCTVVTQLLWNWLMHWWRVNSIARARTVSLHPIINTEHETAWTGRKYRLNKSSMWPSGESSQAYPPLMARAKPTVPHSRFWLDIVTQKKLAQFHNYFVLEKVQGRLLVVNRFLKIKLC